MQVPVQITFVTPHAPHDLDTLAGRFAFARTRLGLTQAQVAKLAGVGQSAIGNIESGDRKQPRKVSAFAKALAVPIEWLEEGGPIPPLRPIGAQVLNLEDGREDDEASGLNQASSNMRLTPRSLSLAQRLDALSNERRARAAALIDLTLRTFEAEDSSAKTRARSRKA